MFAYAAFDISYNFFAFGSSESEAQLLQVVLQKGIGIFVDIEYLSVDICRVSSFHDCEMGGGVIELLTR